MFQHKWKRKLLHNECSKFKPAVTTSEGGSELEHVEEGMRRSRCVVTRMVVSSTVNVDLSKFAASIVSSNTFTHHNLLRLSIGKVPVPEHALNNSSIPFGHVARYLGSTYAHPFPRSLSISRLHSL